MTKWKEDEREKLNNGRKYYWDGIEGYVYLTLSPSLSKREVERQKIEDERQRTLKRFQDDRERQKNPTPIVESTPPVAKKNDLGNTLVKSKSVTLTKTVSHRK